MPVVVVTVVGAVNHSLKVAVRDSKLAGDQGLYSYGDLASTVRHFGANRRTTGKAQIEELVVPVVLREPELVNEAVYDLSGSVGHEQFGVRQLG